MHTDKYRIHKPLQTCLPSFMKMTSKSNIQRAMSRLNSCYVMEASPRVFILIKFIKTLIRRRGVAN